MRADTRKNPPRVVACAIRVRADGSTVTDRGETDDRPCRGKLAGWITSGDYSVPVCSAHRAGASYRLGRLLYRAAGTFRDVENPSPPAE